MLRIEIDSRVDRGLSGRLPRKLAALHESGFDTFQTWRHVRLESVTRNKADVRRLI
jgi:hypothetical protein